MKIIYFSPHPNLHLHLASGPGIHMREMIEGFRALGHEVKPVIMGQETSLDNSSEREHKSLKSRLKAFIPNILWQSMKDYSLLRFDRFAERSLLAEVEEFQPDLIYERGYYMCTSGSRAAARMNVPHIIELNAPYLEERVAMEGKSLWQKTALRRELIQLKNCHRLVVVSSALLKAFDKKLPGCAQKTIVTPNAIRHDLHPPGQGEIARLKAHLNLTDKTVIGFAGSIFPYHGVDKLISAVASLYDENKALHLLIVGDGAVLDELKSQAAALGIQEAVTFTGRVAHKEVFTYMGVMDIAVIPNQGWYMSPIKAFEYGFMGKAIVAVDTTPVRDVMRHNTHALLIDGSEEALAEALKKLISDPLLRQQLGNAFHAKVKDEHHWKAMAEKVLNDAM